MKIFKEFYLKHLISLLFSITGSQIMLFAVIDRFSIMYFITTTLIVIGYYFIFNNVIRLKDKGKSIYIITTFIVFSISVTSILIGSKLYFINYYKWLLSYASNSNSLILYEFGSLLILPFIFSSFVYYYSVNIFRILMLFLISFIPRTLYIKSIGYGLDVANYIFIFLLLFMYIEKNLNNRKTKDFKESINYNLLSIYGSILVGVIFFSAFILPKPSTLPKLNNLANLFDFINKDNTYTLTEKKEVQTNESFKDFDDKVLFSFTGDNTEYLIEKHYTTYNNNTWTSTYLPAVTDSALNESSIVYNLLFTIHENPIVYEILGKSPTTEEGYINFKIENINTKVLPHPSNMRIAFSSDNVDYLKLDDFDRIKSNNYNAYFDKNDKFNIFFYSKDLYEDSFENYIMKKFTLTSFKELIADSEAFLSTQENPNFSTFGYPYDSYYTDDFFEEIELYSLGSGMLSQDVKNLTKKITKGTTSYYYSAKKIEEYLKSDKFTYSLNLPKQKGKGDYINYFILKGKTGYCVQYATAMTLMCRSLGIPTRYVSGYRIDEDNLKGDKYLVKAKDKHAFVEVYLPGYGWKIFDPTPAATNTKQTTFVSSTVNKIDKTLQEKISSPHYIFIGIITLIIIVSVVLGICIYKLYIHITKRPRFLNSVKKLTNGDALESLIKNSLHLLQLCGLTPHPGETLLKFSKRVNENIEVDFTKLVESYYKYKYAGEIVDNIIIEEAFLLNSKIYDLQKIATKSHNM